jgi:CHAT domain-containing protein/Tfp pilus assembly protein PilF
LKHLPIVAGVLLLTACARDPSLADLERDGASAVRRGDLTVAERHIDAGMRIADARHDVDWQRRFRVLRAEVLVEEGRNADALALVGNAAVPADAADPLNVRLLIARGRARCVGGGAGTTELGERDLDAAARLAAARPPGELAASIPLYKGNCAFTRHEIALAEREYRQAYAAARQQKAALLEARAAGSIGRAATRSFRFDEAVTWFERALAGATTDLVRVKTLTNLGWCHYALGDFERALAFLADAEALAQSRGYRGEQRFALEMAGNAHYRLRDRARAADAFRRSLAIARELGDRDRIAELLGNLAIVALDEQQLDKANRLDSEALHIKKELGDVPAIQHSLLTEGLIKAAAGDAGAAEGYYRDVLASPASDRDVQWEARAALAHLRMNAGQPDEADAEFRRAFEIIEQSAAEVRQTEHRLSFYSSTDEFQDAYVDFLVSRGDTRRALEVADRSRARLLREKLQGSPSAQAGTASQFQHVASALHAVILFYWLAPSRSFVWTISQNAIALAILPGEDAIATHVDAYQGFVLRSRDPLAENAADARWLYDTLVQPVRSAVPPGSRVVFVPDGALYQINPETLITSAPAPHYWIEDVTVSIAPSISVLASFPRAPSTSDPSRGILIIGDPVSSAPEFPRLAQASREIARISDRFAPEARTVFSGARANPRAYLGSDPAQYAFIHFAAHASANREAPLESAVVLSPADDTSKLYARDILGVPIRADVVTISACHGAGSRTYAGEGLVGLTWAFLTSGARNVIAALWNVDDASTAALMEDLYARLARGVVAAEALRQSKLALVGSSTAYRKPFYWAPFLTYTRTASPPVPRSAPRPATDPRNAGLFPHTSNGEERNMPKDVTSKLESPSGPEPRIQKERLHFRALLLSNPNYFGNLANSPFQPVTPIQGNKTYEEIGCVGFHPQSKRLDAVIFVKEPFGYSGDVCSNGSQEYVRFYISYDNGATWVDHGYSSVTVYDVAPGQDGSQRREYAVSVPCDPKQNLCLFANTIRARAILSWSQIPPANQPNWPPVWGEVHNTYIQVDGRRRLDWLEVADQFQLKLPQTLVPLIDTSATLALKEPAELTVAELHAAYKGAHVEPHRYALAAVQKLLAQPAAAMDLSPAPANAIFADLGLKLDDIIGAIVSPADGNTSYEQLECVGFNPVANEIVAVLRVKKSTGYSGGPCTAGSLEYVTFWADLNNNGTFETCLGSASVRVHDIQNIPQEGLEYSVYLPVNLAAYKQPCEDGPRLIPIRAILSWATVAPCAFPNKTPVWGNHEDTLILLQPGKPPAPGEFKPVLFNVSTIAVCDINQSTGLAPGDRPFGGALYIVGDIPGADSLPTADRFKYRIFYREYPAGDWQPLTNKFGVTVDQQTGPGTLVQLPLTQGVDLAGPYTGYYTYREYGVGTGTWRRIAAPFAGLLAVWNTAQPMTGRWEIRIEAVDTFTGTSTTYLADTTTCIDGTTRTNVVVTLDEIPPAPEITITDFSTDGGVTWMPALACGEFAPGVRIRGTYKVIDEHFGSLTITVEPAGPAGGATVSPPSRSYPVVPTGGETGTWTLDTTPMQPCGYVVRLDTSDRTIVNAFGGWYNFATVGFCLRRPS